MTSRHASLLFFALACNGTEEPDKDEDKDATDTDLVVDDTDPGGDTDPAGDTDDTDACVPTGATEEACDGIDDDCDGAVDEAFVGGPSECAGGPCEISCVAGELLVDACPTDPTLLDDTDHDGDGLIDCNDDDDDDDTVLDADDTCPRGFIGWVPRVTEGWETGVLPVAHWADIGLSLGSEAFFTGGPGGPATPEGRDLVQVYNERTDSWRSEYLSFPRVDVAGAVVNGQAWFIGGGNGSDVIDVYDPQTGAWTTRTMPLARTELTAVSTGDKLYLACDDTDRVDIYDVATDTWSTDTLSSTAWGCSGFAVGDAAFFVGGRLVDGGANRDHVDAWDASGSFTDTLSQARHRIGTAASGDIAVVAGGLASGFSNVVDIYDASQDSWSTATLAEGRGRVAAVGTHFDILLVGGERPSSQSSRTIDRLDLTTMTWTSEELAGNRIIETAAMAGDTAVFPGGNAPGSGWNNNTLQDTVDYYRVANDIDDDGCHDWKD